MTTLKLEEMLREISGEDAALELEVICEEGQMKAEIFADGKKIASFIPDTVTIKLL